MGHDVTLFAPRIHLKPPEGSACEALPVWHAPGTPSFLCSLQVGRRIAQRIAAKHRLDVVHSQNERGSIFLASQVATELGIPHVHTFHSNYVGTHRTTPLVSGLNSLTYLPWASHLLGRFNPTGSDIEVGYPGSPSAAEDSRFARRDWRSLARMARHLDAFTSPAQFMIETIVEASHGCLANRGFVVESGVSAAFNDAVRQRPRGQVIRFISCGRLGVEKRVDALLRAMSQLDRDNVELHIIGTGPAESSLRKLATQVRHGKVRFLGHFDDVGRLAQEIADADVFVLASYHFDTQGMVLAEAAAAGTPVVYCDDRLHVGIGPDNAVLAGHTPEGLARALRALVDDPSQLPAMSAAAKERGRHLTPSDMEAKYVEVYRTAISRRAEG